MSVSVIIKKPLHSTLSNAQRSLSSVDTRFDLIDMTDESGQAHRGALIAQGLLKPYVYHIEDDGADRPRLTQASVDTLRTRLIASGYLKVGTTTRAFTDEDGRTRYYEAIPTFSTELPVPLRTHVTQE